MKIVYKWSHQDFCNSHKWTNLTLIHRNTKDWCFWELYSDYLWDVTLTCTSSGKPATETVLSEEASGKYSCMFHIISEKQRLQCLCGPVPRQKLSQHILWGGKRGHHDFVVVGEETLQPVWGQAGNILSLHQRCRNLHLHHIRPTTVPLIYGCRLLGENL